MAQHAGITEERWASFSLSQQVLMIGNEMNRAGKLLALGKSDSLLRSYERVLALMDLTICVQKRAALRKELLRWRELVRAF